MMLVSPESGIAQGCVPGVCGAWDARRDLSLGSNEGDIAHAALLPFDDAQVLFWCQIKGWGQEYFTYRWKAVTPTHVTTYGVPVPQGGNPGDFELKCSVAMFNDQGVLKTYGGDDPNQWFPPGSTQQTFVGVKWIYRFDPLAANPRWHQEKYAGVPVTIYDQRWYLSGTMLNDNGVFLFGHAFEPPTIPAQRYDLYQNGQWHNGVLENRQYRGWQQQPPLTDPCEPVGPTGDGLLQTSQYPRIRMLGKNGDVMWVDGWDDTTYGPTNGGQLTALMNLDVTASLCPTTDVLPQYRWEIGRPTLPSPPDDSKNPYSHVAHYVTYDLTPSGNVHDILYRVSGGDRAFCSANLNNKTLRMIDPVPGDHQNWTELPADLNKQRIFGNLVILADGSLFFVGGYDKATGHIYTPERYEPKGHGVGLVDVFPNSTEKWHTLPDMAVDRREHQVALLLPDGSVWVAGGLGGCAFIPSFPTTAWQSYEIYHPAYTYQYRPEITDVGGTWGYGGTLGTAITVEFGGGLYEWPQSPPPAIKRVALIRNGVSTHHDDQHQRYIEVPIASVFPGAGGTQDVIVGLPPDAKVAPQGWYMLVVIDEHGRPSPGRFIKLS